MAGPAGALWLDFIESFGGSGEADKCEAMWHVKHVLYICENMVRTLIGWCRVFFICLIVRSSNKKNIEVLEIQEQIIITQGLN